MTAGLNSDSELQKCGMRNAECGLAESTISHSAFRIPHSEIPHYVALGWILALAAMLRFVQIGKLELWFDENYSVVMALWPQGVLRGALNDTNPPLYLYLLKAWMLVFGVSATAVRSLSAVLGVAQLAVLAAWLRSFDLPRRAVLWAATLGALAPLHVYYAQEGRAYTLTWLLLTLALWSFTRAAASGRWRAWLTHSLVMALALYTHNLVMLFIPLFWCAGGVWRLDRRGWLRMAASYALAGALYAPWLVLTARVVLAGSLGWIAETWSAAAAPWMIPGSLESLGSGGKIPGIFRMLSPPEWVRWMGLAWLVELLGAAVLMARVKEGDGQRKVLFLSLFALGPLALLLGYSLALRPLYVVGRYDTLVFPALLGLMGLGAWRCEMILRRRVPARLATTLVVCVPLIVALHVFPERLRPLSPEMYARLHPQEVRGALLKDYYQLGDTIVCLGLEGTRIAYQALRLGIDPPLLTYPLSTRQHMGYILTHEVARDEAALRKDAREIVESLKGGVSAKGEKRGGRVWVVLDRYAFRAVAPGATAEDAAQIADATKIATALLEALGAAGFKEWDDPAFRQRARVTGMRIYLAARPLTATR